jgi:hypothetical protein
MDLNFQRSFCYANFPALLCEHFLVQEIILAIVCVYVVIDFALPGPKGAAEFLQIHCPRNSCKNAEIAYIRLAPMEAVQIGMGEKMYGLFAMAGLQRRQCKSERIGIADTV